LCLAFVLIERTGGASEWYPAKFVMKSHLIIKILSVIQTICTVCVPFLLLGCGTLSEVTPVELSEPGWRLREGQAVWRPPSRPEIAGELVLATHMDGRVWLNFSKPPFTIFTASSDDKFWQIEFPQLGKKRSGRSPSPSRFLWLHLPWLLEDEPPPSSWKSERSQVGRWTFKNLKTGEFILVDLPYE